MIKDLTFTSLVTEKFSFTVLNFSGVTFFKYWPLPINVLEIQSNTPLCVVLEKVSVVTPFFKASNHELKLVTREVGVFNSIKRTVLYYVVKCSHSRQSALQKERKGGVCIQIYRLRILFTYLVLGTILWLSCIWCLEYYFSKHIVKNIQISAVKDTVLKWNLTSILRLYLPISS